MENTVTSEVLLLHPPVSSLCKPLSLLQLDLGCLTTRLSFSQQVWPPPWLKGALLCGTDCSPCTAAAWDHKETGTAAGYFHAANQSRALGKKLKIDP